MTERNRIGGGGTMLPGTVMPAGNKYPSCTFTNSWEITSNICGANPAHESKTMLNDDQTVLPIHLIDENLKQSVRQTRKQL